MAVADRPANLPPQDIDAEESVLGAMLVSQTAIAIVSELLKPDDFYRGSHAQIYRTILEMYGKGEIVDSITLTNALDKRGVLDHVGGKAVVHTLASTVPAAANARHYAQIVRDTATYRWLIRAGTDIAGARLRAHRRAAGARRPGRADRLLDRRQADHDDFEPIDGLLMESFERLDEMPNRTTTSPACPPASRSSTS